MTGKESGESAGGLREVKHGGDEEEHPQEGSDGGGKLFGLQIRVPF